MCVVCVVILGCILYCFTPYTYTSYTYTFISYTTYTLLYQAFAIDGYPSLFFIPAHDKTNIIKYDGGHGKDDIINFIKGNIYKEVKVIDESGEGSDEL